MGPFPAIGDVLATQERLSTIETVSSPDSLDPTRSNSIQLLTSLGHKCLSRSALPTFHRSVGSVLFTESNAMSRDTTCLDASPRVTVDDLPLFRNSGSTYEFTSAGGQVTISVHTNATVDNTILDRGALALDLPSLWNRIEASDLLVVRVTVLESLDETCLDTILESASTGNLTPSLWNLGVTLESLGTIVPSETEPSLHDYTSSDTITVVAA